MTIDCFPFFNEIDLLEIRLNELDSVVDKFVLVEAELTQSLLPKKLYFEENKDRFNKFLHKIEHIKLTKEQCVNNDGNLWNMENFQRDCIKIGLDNIAPDDNDIVMISDLDEIPESKSVNSIVNLLNESTEHNIVSLDMGFFAYFLNLKASERNWVGTVISKYGYIKNVTPQSIRNNKDYFPRKPDSGWHFSWMGGYEKVYEKSISCIEPFDKSKLPSKDEFKNYFNEFLSSENKFFIHLEQLDKKELPFSIVEIDDSFPQVILDNLNKYSQYIA
jgi:beta-1,4-mannosyl-glycoprotein beta-1,4-N-acetylglucosaminyltransferase